MPRRPRPTGRRTRLPETPRSDSMTRTRAIHLPIPPTVAAIRFPISPGPTTYQHVRRAKLVRPCTGPVSASTKTAETRQDRIRETAGPSCGNRRRRPIVFLTPNTSVSCTASVYGPIAARPQNRQSQHGNFRRPRYFSPPYRKGRPVSV